MKAVKSCGLPANEKVIYAVLLKVLEKASDHEHPGDL
jgi:hypothetical protein